MRQDPKQEDETGGSADAAVTATHSDKSSILWPKTTSHISLMGIEK